MMDAGWIAVSRMLPEHPVVGFGQPVKPDNPNKGAFSRAEAWLDLIMLARWKDGTERNRGRSVQMEAGQLQGGYSFLAKRWNWTLKTVRNFLEKLIGEKMLGKTGGSERGNQIQVLTVCNYKEYQILDEEEGQAKGRQRAGKGQHLNKDTRIQVEDSSLRSESTPADDGQGEDGEDEVDSPTDPRWVLWNRCVPWLIKHTGKSERSIKTLVGKWQKKMAPAALVPAIRNAGENHLRGKDLVAYISGAVERAAASAKRDENGNLVVVNGFKAELEGRLKGRNLQHALDRINGFIPQSLVGVDLEARVRSEVIKMVDIEESYEKRFVGKSPMTMPPASLADKYRKMYEGVL